MTITGSKGDWERVGESVKARRLELGLTIEEALARAHPKISRSVWSNLERGVQESYQPISLAAVARALHWSADSIEKILAGEQPVEPVDDAPQMVETEIGRRLRDMERQIAELRNIVEERLPLREGDVG